MAIDLKSLIRKDTDILTARVEFKEGITLILRYVSRERMRSLWSRCTTLRYDQQTRARIPRAELSKFSEEFAVLAVAGWEGVTPRTLGKIVPTDLSGVPEKDLDVEIPFSEDGLRALVKQAYDLDNFVQEEAVKPELFSPNQENEIKNLSSSQSPPSQET
jgi:hypothetical protein